MKAVGEGVSCLIIVVTGKNCSFVLVQLSFWSSLEMAYSVLVVSFSWIGLVELSET